jgi:hypothetical protein
MAKRAVLYAGAEILKLVAYITAKFLAGHGLDSSILKG